ncbi:MAG: MFS transporter, partial [Pseudomonadota bacterium]
SEHCSVTAASGAMAAYITGNVASNLFGRLLATGVAEGIGLSEAFYAFAALNLAGGALAAAVIGLREPRGAPARGGGRARAALGAHLRQPELRSAFIVGFLILFAFVGVYTFVNLELTGPAYGLEPAMLGLVYFVFLPSMLTTPSAGAVARRFGARRVVLASLALAGAGLALTVFGLLWAMLAGLAVVAVGLFFAQGAATGYVGRVATHDHGAASGLYLTSYYLGGLVGAFAVGQAYQAAGWSGVAAAVAAALAAGAAATWRMRDPGAPRREDE